MIFTTFAYKGNTYPAVLKDDKVISLDKYGLPYKTLEEAARFMTDSELEMLKESGINEGINVNEVTLMPAIMEPFQEVIIMENNFVQNGDSLPTYFYKKASYASCSGAVIPSYPGHVTELDYQAEVCVVVRNDLYQVSVEEAGNHIFGYLLINNVIGRNLTLRHRRPYIATSLDGYLPMGSLIVTPDEFEKPIELRSYVNGELRQKAKLDQVKFGFDYAISDLCRISVLRGGSLISSGTPFGTAKDLGGSYLQSGDVVTVEADRLGTITNVVG